MRRVTWFSVGAATGIYGILKARRAAQSLTPGGLRARAAAVGAGFRVFSAEVTVGMAEREAELRADTAMLPRGANGVVPTEIEQAAPSPASPPRHRRSVREDTGTDGHR